MDHSSPWGAQELERRITRYLGLWQVVALMVVLLAFLLRRLIPPWLPLTTSILAIATFAAWLVLLYLRYRTVPIVREKRELMREEARLAASVAEADAAARGAVRKRQVITEEGERAISDRRARHEASMTELARRLADIEASETRELRDSLARLQAAFVEDGLHSQTLRDAKMAGIGPKLKDRLAVAGLTVAADVTEARLRGVPGFGEAKIASALEWRRFVEEQLRNTQPRQLPSSQEILIRAKHGEAANLVQAEEDAELKQLPIDLAAIQQNTSERHAANDRSEAEARQEAFARSAEREAVRGKLAPYAVITFPGFVRATLPSGVAGGSARKKALAGAATAAIPVVLILQASGAVWATGAVVVAAIPTSTPTPTSTGTMTPSATLTPSFTPTTTLTPTITDTPTISPTHTITDTSTTMPTPPPTIPAIAAAGCIPASGLRQTARVVGVTDGDTIRVTIGAANFSVRYIGMDTDELGGPHGYEAHQRNSQHVYGQTVTLVRDQSETDRYDRLLRYVFVGETFVNYQLVIEGWGTAMSYPPDTACDETFEEAERLARANDAGIWAPTRTPYPTQPGGPVGNCSPAYPTVCIPPPPPDLDCGDIPYRRFTVLPPDPHNFDRDGDGIGCES